MRAEMPRARINARVYRSLGADPKRLRVQYDLDPRNGQTPVAYTTFDALAGKTEPRAAVHVFSPQ